MTIILAHPFLSLLLALVVLNTIEDMWRDWCDRR